MSYISVLMSHFFTFYLCLFRFIFMPLECVRAILAQSKFNLHGTSSPGKWWNCFSFSIEIAYWCLKTSAEYWTSAAHLIYILFSSLRSAASLLFIYIFFAFWSWEFDCEHLEKLTVHTSTETRNNKHITNEHAPKTQQWYCIFGITLTIFAYIRFARLCVLVCVCVCLCVGTLRHIFANIPPVCI